MGFIITQHTGILFRWMPSGENYDAGIKQAL